MKQRQAEKDRNLLCHHQRKQKQLLQEIIFKNKLFLIQRTLNQHIKHSKNNIFFSNNF